MSFRNRRRNVAIVSFGPLARRQRFVEDREGAIDVACPGFGSGERDLHETVVAHNILFAQKRDPPPRNLEPAAGCLARADHPPFEENAPRMKQLQLVLSRCSRKVDSVRRCTREVAAHEFEHGGVQSPECSRPDMLKARESRLGAVDDRNRASDVAQRP